MRDHVNGYRWMYERGPMSRLAGTCEKLLMRCSTHGVRKDASCCVQQFVCSILFEVASPLGSAMLDQDDTLWPETILESKLVGHFIDIAVLELRSEVWPTLQKG